MCGRRFDGRCPTRHALAGRQLADKARGAGARRKAVSAAGSVRVFRDERGGTARGDDASKVPERGIALARNPTRALDGKGNGKTLAAGTMDAYEIIRTVGKGSFGRVYLVKHKVERKHFCMKTIKLEGMAPSERRATQMEVKLLETMMHPNIVGFKESFIGRGGKLLCIVMTYCDGGDLAERLKQNGSRLFKEDQVLHWFVQLALGLHFMHEMNDKCVLHRDLKTQNIFLLGNGRLVIGDLGISKVLDHSTDFTKTTIGTPYYMSPEVYKSKPYNHKSDIWALGCVLYEMTTLKHAFNANSLNGLMGKVVKGRYEPISRSYSRNLRDLLDRMLSIDPASRPSLPQILSMPFIKRHVFQLLRNIAERPTGQLGDGTMVLRSAALGVAANSRSPAASFGFKADTMLRKQTRNLKKQLESLGMEDLVHRAFRDDLAQEQAQEQKQWVQDEHEQAQEQKQQAQRALRKLRGRVERETCESERENRSVNQRASPTQPRKSALKRAAKEQRNALAIERERKRAVESALDKLRNERVIRAKERKLRVERQRKRQELVRQRQEQLRRDEERRRASLLAKNRESQRRAVERAKQQPAQTSRWARQNPRLVAQRKAREFELKHKASRDQQRLQRFSHGIADDAPPPPPPSPPPPPPRQSRGAESPPTSASKRDQVLALKQERKREAEKVQRDALRQAARDRMSELRQANALHHHQFHGRVAGKLMTPVKEQPFEDEDEDDDHDHVEQRETQEELLLVAGDDEHEAATDDVRAFESDAPASSPESPLSPDSPDSPPSDNSDDDSSIGDEMQHADSDDDDLDNKEEELRMELQVATMRCTSIRQTLQEVRAVLKDSSGSPMMAGAAAAAAVAAAAEHSEDENVESHDDDEEEEEEEEEEGDDDADDEVDLIDENDNEEERTKIAKDGVAVPQQKVQQHLEHNYADPRKTSKTFDDCDSESSCSDSSSDDGLFSPMMEDNSGGFVPAQRGGLKQRIETLEDECKTALGIKRFEQVFNLLQENLRNKLNERETSTVSAEKRLHGEISALLAPDGKLAYWTKMDTLIFMQEAL